MGQTFTKADRVRRRADYLQAQTRGRRLHTPHFVILLRDRQDGAPARLGLVTSRKVGNSVQRHRLRRQLRETFRTHREAFPAGKDVVVVVRSDTGGLALATIRDEILGAFARRRARPPDGVQPGGRAP